MKERLKKIRKDANLTQQEFGDRIGIKRNTLAQYETGRNEPIDAIVSLICREFGVNKDWLRTGSGDPYRKEPKNELDALVKKYNLSDKDYLFVEKLIADPDARESLENFCIDYCMSVLRYQARDSAAEQDRIAALEAAYAETLNSASSTGSSASNTTEGRDLKKAQ